MTRRGSSKSKRPTGAVLGIEGGATHTQALLVNGAGRVVWKGTAGPGNVRLLSDVELRQLLKKLRGPIARPAAVAIGLAGARSPTDQARIVRAVEGLWPGVPLRATNDLETGLAAGRMAGRSRSKAQAWVLVLSGTGSCCFGRSRDGRTAKVGGWGHVLGDRGSGYEFGLDGLRRVLTAYDRSAVWPRLGGQFLRALMLNSPEELSEWAQTAQKHEVAGLAREVFKAWARGDALARLTVDQGLRELVEDAAACAARLARQGQPVEFILAGGVLTSQPRLAARLNALLRAHWPGSAAQVLRRDSVWGAVQLARELSGQAAPLPEADEPYPSIRGLGRSPTEQRNPRSMNLDRMPTGAAVALMLREEARVVPALLKHERKLARAVEWIAEAFRRRGRLFYVGAGTSGRLGVLDASECPPTFGTDPELVQGIIAGGRRALWESVEGAEDDRGAGEEAIAFRDVRARDVVLGIAASGRTPFVWGALEEARRRRARTLLLCFNPKVEIAKGRRPDLVLAVAVGPEVLTGSTRLKAGTATKLVLNLLTTLAMVRLGKVRGNLMIDLNPSNTKLRDRAVRIVRELAGLDAASALDALRRTGWNVQAACELATGAGWRSRAKPSWTR